FLPFGALARVVVGDGAALALYRSRAFAIGKSLLARWAALAATNGAARRTTLDAVAIPVLTKAATGSPDQVSGIAAIRSRGAPPIRARCIMSRKTRIGSAANCTAAGLRCCRQRQQQRYQRNSSDQ